MLATTVDLQTKTLSNIMITIHPTLLFMTTTLLFMTITLLTLIHDCLYTMAVLSVLTAILATVRPPH